MLVGRNEELLKRVMSELNGAEHRVMIGDVGTDQFWRGIKKEVCFRFHLHLVLLV